MGEKGKKGTEALVGKEKESIVYCVGVKRHVNPCGSFCVVSQRKGEKR